MLQSDYSDAYIVVKRTITITVANNRDRRNKSSVLKKVLHLLAAYHYLLLFLLFLSENGVFLSLDYLDFEHLYFN